MGTCIICINDGHDILMGHACSNTVNGIGLKPSVPPVFRSGKNLLVGVAGDPGLVIDMQLSFLIMSQSITKINAMESIRREMFAKNATKNEILVLANNNMAYHYRHGDICAYDGEEEPYLCIGENSGAAFGLLYGLQYSRFTAKEAMETCLKAMARYFPEMSNVGYISL